jgi:hypothetical protein
MAADNYDYISGSKIVSLTVTGASANTQTTKWSGGEGTVAIFGTSGSSGFISGTAAIQATPDELICPYTTIQSALGAVTTTGTSFVDFRLPKGWFLRGNMSGGTTNNNVTVQFFNNRATDERTA